MAIGCHEARYTAALVNEKCFVDLTGQGRLLCDTAMERALIIGDSGGIGSAVKSALEAKGIAYSDWGESAVKGWHQVYFYDPDGNVIEVHQKMEST